jgi:hypothetical protein
MKAAAKKLDPAVARQEVATVVVAAQDSAAMLTVRASGGTYEARRAASCLLAPEVGDEVLVAIIPGRPCYVLAVLERDVAAPARLEVTGDLALQARGGRVSIAASTGLDLVTEGGANVVASELDVRAARGSVVLDQLSLLGRAVVASLGDAKVVSTALETVTERLVQRAKRAYRFVDGLDQVRAERLDYTADETASVRAKNTVLTAEQLVKVDGEQIHVG